MSLHPELTSQGFHVLHINPLGYVTPNGPDDNKRAGENWPVLPNTIAGTGAGYETWLAQCVAAVGWAMSLPEVLPGRVSFFGTSQGGGGALLLGSLFQGRGVRCVAADVPFLTHFPISMGRGAYRIASDALDRLEKPHEGWTRLGFADTISHAHRLDAPVLLTAGGKDDCCQPDSIQALFHRLPGTKSYHYFENVSHRYTAEFVIMAAAWFRLYA